MVAHVIDYDLAGWSPTLARMRSAAFDLDSANALGNEGNRARTPAELVDLLAAHLQPRGLTALFGGRIALLDALVHHQDIRRPLGLPRSIPPARLVPALNFARIAFSAGIPRRIRGLAFEADDVDWDDVGWTAGRGPRVSGPAEAVLMIMAGRGVALADVSGPGVPVLAERIAT